MNRALAIAAGIGAAALLAGCGITSIDPDGVTSTEVRR